LTVVCRSDSATIIIAYLANRPKRQIDLREGWDVRGVESRAALTSAVRCMIGADLFESGRISLRRRRVVNAPGLLCCKQASPQGGAAFRQRQPPSPACSQTPRLEGAKDGKAALFPQKSSCPRNVRITWSRARSALHVCPLSTTTCSPSCEHLQNGTRARIMQPRSPTRHNLRSE